MKSVLVHHTSVLIPVEHDNASCLAGTIVYVVTYFVDGSKAHRAMGGGDSVMSVLGTYNDHEFANNKAKSFIEKEDVFDPSIKVERVKHKSWGKWKRDIDDGNVNKSRTPEGLMRYCGKDGHEGLKVVEVHKQIINAD